MIWDALYKHEFNLSNNLSIFTLTGLLTKDETSGTIVRICLGQFSCIPCSL